MVQQLKNLVALTALFALAMAVPNPSEDINHLQKRVDRCGQVRQQAYGIKENIHLQGQELKDLKAVKSTDPALHQSHKTVAPGTPWGHSPGGHTRRDVQDQPALEARNYGGMPPGHVNPAPGTHVKANADPHSGFQTNVNTLRTDIAKGQDIRVHNQKTLAPNNPAQPGLAKVAQAQSKESALASQLNGTPADVRRIKTLEGDFKAGIAQNKQNYKAALVGCKRDIEKLNDLMARMVDMDHVQARDYQPLDTRSLEAELQAIEA